MPAVPFHYVDLRTFAYATEDDQRVERALRHFLPEETAITRQESEGHSGDRILVLSARLENADDVRHVLSVAAEAEEFDVIADELDQRVTENCELFASFDKQAAYGGETRLGDGLKLRAKVEAYPATKDAAVENAAEALAAYEAESGQGAGEESDDDSDDDSDAESREESGDESSGESGAESGAESTDDSGAASGEESDP